MPVFLLSFFFSLFSSCSLEEFLEVSVVLILDGDSDEESSGNNRDHVEASEEGGETSDEGEEDGEGSGFDHRIDGDFQRRQVESNRVLGDGRVPAVGRDDHRGNFSSVLDLVELFGRGGQDSRENSFSSQSCSRGWDFNNY